jgi:microcystin-dependent protein
MNYFIGQIGVFGFNFAPRQWAQCTGAILPISQNTALFSLLGTTYGGNGTTTFGLPDLRSRTPIMFGPQTSMGEMGGAESVNLNTTQMPQHTHLVNALSTAGSLSKLDNAIHAGCADVTSPHNPENFYGPSTGPALLNVGTVSMAGGSQPHNNIQPSLAINFCIATGGTYPSRN